MPVEISSATVQSLQTLHVASLFYWYEGVLCILWGQAWWMVPSQASPSFASLWTLRYDRAAEIIDLYLM